MEALGKLAGVFELEEAAFLAEFAAARAGAIRDSDIAVARFGGAVAVRDPHYPHLSRTVALGLNGRVSAADIADLIEFYHSSELPLTIDVSPMADAGLFEALALHPFRLLGFRQVWFCSLAQQNIQPRISSGFTVSNVTETEAELWAKTMESVYTAYGQQQLGDVTMLLAQYAMEHCYCVAIKKDEELAGGAVLARQNSVGLFCGGGTVPGFTRQGVYDSLLRARLRIAQALGCSMAVVYLMPGHAREIDYHRHGFQLAYSRATMQLPVPAPPEK